MEPPGIEAIADIAEQARAEQQGERPHGVEVLGKSPPLRRAGRFLDAFFEQRRVDFEQLPFMGPHQRADHADDSQGDQRQKAVVQGEYGLGDRDDADFGFQRMARGGDKQAGR